HDYCHLMSRTLSQRGFVGSEKAIRRSFIENFFDHVVAKSLGSLSQDYRGSRNCRLDDGALGGAFDLLDSVDRRQAGNRSTILLGASNDVVDNFGRDQGPHGIVYKDDVIRSSIDGVQSVLHRLLPMLTANNKFHFLLQNVACFLLQSIAKTVDLVLA